MKKEDQVTSVELSKELNELGVKQDSIFWWVKHIKSGTNYHTWDLVFGKDENDFVNKYISAYTVAELGEMLPTDYVTGKLTVDEENAQKWACVYLSIPEFEPWWDRLEFADTEADVRAKMLIYLIKEGIIEI